jgi:hypothetical protein
MDPTSRPRDAKSDDLDLVTDLLNASLCVIDPSLTWRLT